MVPVLVAVALGVLVGHLNILALGSKTIGKFTTLCLIIMLLTMGAQLGANDKLLADLGRMGYQALLLALGSIIGSVFFVRLAENQINRQLRRPNSEGSE
ncbi:LysO family transporter [Desulfotomaculum sp. 1211_IL3151]|uniref:LysO family transporter n=1 Tax=Desulfotomaculum sp. 1211_IL3151 TaxID=3084055 RepID=UPI002FD92206